MGCDKDLRLDLNPECSGNMLHVLETPLEETPLEVSCLCRRTRFKASMCVYVLYVQEGDEIEVIGHRLHA